MDNQFKIGTELMVYEKQEAWKRPGDTNMVQGQRMQEKVSGAGKGVRVFPACRIL